MKIIASNEIKARKESQKNEKEKRSQARDSKKSGKITHTIKATNSN